MGNPVIGQNGLPPAVSSKSPVAYFSMEFGVNAALPLYAGGLGILSGDVLKAASDLDMPLVGVGLLYRRGYLKQKINEDGSQSAENPLFDISGLPVEIVRKEDGQEVTVAVELPGRKVTVKLWKMDVGKVPLFLLDTDMPGNSAEDRRITEQLYTDYRDTRIQQEMILGIGGMRSLAVVGIKPSICHLNEGHTAFALMEKCRGFMVDEGMDLCQAKEMTRASSVLTVHTPAPAGNERFGRSRLSEHLTEYLSGLGMDFEDFWKLGANNHTDGDSFIMTAMALRCVNSANAVSRVHMGISREMWQDVWKGFPLSEVPISSIRNGVHLPTWTGPEMQNVFREYVGDEWSVSSNGWNERVREIPDEALWEAHSRQKKEAMSRLKSSRPNTDHLREELLTLVWAKRFAPYKRPSLIFRDFARLLRIVHYPLMPMQIIIAGKAHPGDPHGTALIKEVAGYCRREEVIGKIVFVEDYDIETAQNLVQIADVWLNTPIRRMEASGTSGIKAAANGAINMSVLDGWWEEAFDGSNGWTVGKPQAPDDPEAADDDDADMLYFLLENNVLPTFYDRAGGDIPIKWTSIIKSSMRTIIPEYSMSRVIADYFERMYLPAYERTSRLAKNGFEAAAELGRWKNDMMERFQTVAIDNVSVTGMEGNVLRAGSTVTVEAVVSVGQVRPDELLVEMALFPSESDGPTQNPFTLRMTPDEKTGDNRYVFRGRFEPVLSGKYSYGIRAVPYHRYLGSKQELGLIRWG